MCEIIENTDLRRHTMQCTTASCLSPPCRSGECVCVCVCVCVVDTGMTHV